LSYISQFIIIGALSVDDHRGFNDSSGIQLSVYGKYAEFYIEPFGVIRVPFPDKLRLNSGKNNVTIILDMRKNQDNYGCASYFKVNDTPLTNVITDIPYSKKRIEFVFESNSSLTLISTTHLKVLPIDTRIKYTYNSVIDKNPLLKDNKNN
jgi:hypothetical protein